MTQRIVSLWLSTDELAVLQAIAVKVNAVPSQGPQTTQPTWRTVVKWIASGKLLVVTPGPQGQGDTR